MGPVILLVVSKPEQIVDLRSDTVTQPTAAMREAIAAAEVGDDVYGEDPSVNRLQEVAAERCGKEAALFVPSGSMANQVAIRSHTEPGDAAITAHGSHSYLYESGAAAAVSGVQFTLIGRNGLFDADEVRAAVYPTNDHYPRTRLLCVENTHNRSGGRLFPFDDFCQVAAVARDAGLRVHLDGARIFNAEVASGVPVARFAAEADSLSFCLSKGLGAPVGSLVVGSAEFIHRAHRFRKMLGGGMRQAGILAAAGLVALDTMVDRLAEDHQNARRLAEGLANIGGLAVDADSIQTNIVIFDIDEKVGEAPHFIKAMKDAEVLVSYPGERSVRMVTHRHISGGDVEEALSRTSRVVRELQG